MSRFCPDFTAKLSLFCPDFAQKGLSRFQFWLTKGSGYMPNFDQTWHLDTWQHLSHDTWQLTLYTAGQCARKPAEKFGLLGDKTFPLLMIHLNLFREATKWKTEKSSVFWQTGGGGNKLFPFLAEMSTLNKWGCHSDNCPRRQLHISASNR